MSTLPVARSRMVNVRWPARVALLIALVASLIAFTWPLFVVPGSQLANLSGSQAPFVLALVLPLVLLVALTQLTVNGVDVKALAMLGVLTAVVAVLRPMGAGTAGIEPMFFLLILAGYVYGAGFGFILGNTAMIASALLTGGVGPWLPYQMLAAGYVGMFAGLLPRFKGWWEIALLAVYGFFTGFFYGYMMDLAFWPFMTGPTIETTYTPGAPVLVNLRNFTVYCIVTALAWDFGRAVTTMVLILLLGKGVLLILRRAARKGAFAETITH